MAEQERKRIGKMMAGPPDEMAENHSYNDYANEAEKALEASGDDLNHGEDNFPVKLHYMIKELENDGMADIVSWQPHGRCFLVHKQLQFVERILPLWFRQSKFPSFQRQLNLYGFKRLTSGRDKGGYYHERFLRSKPFLSHHIQRTKIKGKGPRKPSCPMTEPDFYSTPYLPNASENTGDPSFNTIWPPVPNMNLASAGSISLQRLIGAPISAPIGAPAHAVGLHQHHHQHHHQHQQQPPPQYNVSHLQQNFQDHQAHLEHLRMVSLFQNMQGLPSLDQQSAPTLYGRQNDQNMTMAAALSRTNQDPAAFALSRTNQDPVAFARSRTVQDPAAFALSRTNQDPAAFAQPGYWNGAPI